jgi:hypothetical protein
VVTTPRAHQAGGELTQLRSIVTLWSIAMSQYCSKVHLELSQTVKVKLVMINACERLREPMAVHSREIKLMRCEHLF